MKSKVKVISSNRKPTDKSLRKGEIAIGKVEDIPNKVFANDGNGVKDITGSKVLYFQTQDELDKFIADGKAPEGVSSPVSVPEQLSGNIADNEGNRLYLEPSYNNSNAFKLRLNDCDKYLDAKIISTDDVDVATRNGFSYNSSDATTIVTKYTGAVNADSGGVPVMGLVDLYYLITYANTSRTWSSALRDTGSGDFRIYAARRTDESGSTYYVPLMPKRTVRFRRTNDTTTFTPYYVPSMMTTIATTFPTLRALEAGQSISEDEQLYYTTLTVAREKKSSITDTIELGSWSSASSSAKASEQVTAEANSVVPVQIGSVDVDDLVSVSNASELTESEKEQIGGLTPLFPRFFSHVVLDGYAKPYDSGKGSETKIGTATANLIAVDGDLNEYISANAKYIKRSISGINWSDDVLARSNATIDADRLRPDFNSHYDIMNVFNSPSQIEYKFACTLTVPAQTAGEKVTPDGVWYAVVMDDKAV